MAGIVSQKVLGTHSGKFHLDEVLALVMLRFLPQFSNSKILRSREASVWSSCDILVDVGGVYDPSTNRFDHHQSSFQEFFYEDESHPKISKLSSAGLIYKHFGREILKTKFNVQDAADLDVIYGRVYDLFVLAVDANDNGVAATPSPLYVDVTGLSHRVSACYPPWNDNVNTPARLERQKRLKAESALWESVEVDGGWAGEVAGFKHAMHIVKVSFEDYVNEMIDGWLAARTIIKSAVEDRMSVDPSGRIIQLKEYCSFHDHIYQLEKELNMAPVLFVLYPDIKKGSVVGWRVYALQVEGEAFKSRLPLCAKWRGLADLQMGEIVCEDAADKTIMPKDFIHCHHSGFIAGVKTLAAAKELCLQTFKNISEEERSALGL